jgi:hypothetical protein
MRRLLCGKLIIYIDMFRLAEQGLALKVVIESIFLITTYIFIIYKCIGNDDKMTQKIRLKRNALITIKLNNIK